MENQYHNSVTSFIQGIFGQSAQSKEREVLLNLANEPATPINPLIFIIPVGAILIFTGIYFIVLKK